jgi:protease-4
MTAEERRLLQAMVDNCYQQFLGDVARGRGVKVEAIRPVADGRIFTGEQARNAGLVDDLGGFWDAVKLAAKLGGVADPEQVSLKRYGGGTMFEQLLSAQAPAVPGAELVRQLTSGLGAGLWFLTPAAPPQLSTR